MSDELGNGIKEHVLAIMFERDKRYEAHFIAIEERIKRQVVVIGLFSSSVGMVLGVLIGHLIK